jgi:structural maintenance of chromosome 3 (chondroitin sulfate proteoglycan 6)
MDAEMESVNQKIQRSQKSLETVQGQQSEDVRLMSKQQKTTERYLAKRQMLMSRKDDCNRNIRDLGVLPEEAFEKYTNEKLEKVQCRLPRLCLGADFPPYSW